MVDTQLHFKVFPVLNKTIHTPNVTIHNILLNPFKKPIDICIINSNLNSVYEKFVYNYYHDHLHINAKPKLNNKRCRKRQSN